MGHFWRANLGYFSRVPKPQGARVRRVELLRAEMDIPFRVSNGSVEFTIPKVVDYEAAALYST